MTDKQPSEQAVKAAEKLDDLELFRTYDYNGKRISIEGVATIIDSHMTSEPATPSLYEALKKAVEELHLWLGDKEPQLDPKEDTGVVIEQAQTALANHADEAAAIGNLRDGALRAYNLISHQSDENVQEAEDILCETLTDYDDAVKGKAG